MSTTNELLLAPEQVKQILCYDCYMAYLYTDTGIVYHRDTDDYSIIGELNADHLQEWQLDYTINDHWHLWHEMSDNEYNYQL